MDMRELELLVPTLFGLEGLCAEELRRLKLPTNIHEVYITGWYQYRRRQLQSPRG